MAAVAAFVEEPTALAEPLDEFVIDPAVGDPSAIVENLEAHNLALAREREIPESVRLLVEELADELAALPDEATLRVDPYLLLAAQRALIGSLRALDSDDPAWARRQMRVRLEQIRQVYRDLAEGGPLYEDRSAKEIARWLASVVDVPQARLAELFGVSPRTFQRWVSESDPIAPEGDDARRLRVVAGVVNHLRHALTGPGTVAWFERPHPRLDGKRPLDLLDEVDAPGRLTALAASTRSHTAA
jgi:putative toxin-antitoxin system antitoxin component (TIGR02293 family)